MTSTAQYARDVCQECGKSVVNMECDCPSSIRTPPATDDAWTIADQFADLLPHLEESVYDVCGDNDSSLRNEVLRRVARRFFTGFDEYGDALFAKTVAQLEDERLDELADATVYGARIKSIEEDERKTLDSWKLATFSGGAWKANT